MREATSLIHISEIKNAQFTFNYVIINKINDVHLCENTDHV